MLWMPTTGLHIIEPDVARELLEKCNIHNRRLDINKAGAIARDIRAGRYHVTGETIKFTKRVRLLDGQHRLKAVDIAGMPIMTYVVAGLEDTPEVFLNIDRGTPKQVGFLLNATGRTNGNQLSSTAGALLCYEMGAVGAAWRKPTINEREETIDRYGEEAILEGIRAAKRCNINHLTPLSALYVLGTLADRNLKTRHTETFFAELDGTAATLAGQPAFALRNQFLTAAMQRKTMRPDVELAFAIKTWNLHARGLPCRALRWRTKSAPNEALPGLIGLGTGRAHYPELDGDE